MGTADEQWRAIPGFRGYEVSDLGRIRSSLTSLGPSAPLRREPRIIQSKQNKQGVYCVVLAGNFGRVTRTVPELVDAAFAIASGHD